MNIGLALGSGASRGWSHIGIIRALIDQGVVPNIICGTSIGSLVGASYVADNLEKLEQWVTALQVLIIKQYWIAASVNFSARPRLPRVGPSLYQSIAA